MPCVHAWKQKEEKRTSPEPSLQPSPEPVEPDLALHQTFPGIRWIWLGFAPKLPGTFSGTFSGSLLNLTWLCTKASHTFSRTFSGTLLNLTWLCTKASRPSSEPCWTWPGSAPKLPDLLRNLRNLVEPDPAPAPVHTGAILGWRPH